MPRDKLEMPWNLAKASKTPLAVKVLQEVDTIAASLVPSVKPLICRARNNLHYQTLKRMASIRMPLCYLMGQVIKKLRHDTGIRLL